MTDEQKNTPNPDNSQPQPAPAEPSAAPPKSEPSASYHKLEFESPQESQIARNAKSIGQKVTDVVPDVAAAHDDLADELDESHGNFWVQLRHVLATAGFSFGKVLGCFLGVIALAAVIVFFVAGGFQSIVNYFSSTPSSDTSDLPFLQQSSEQIQQLSNLDALKMVDDAGLTTNFIIGGYQGLHLVRSQNLTPGLQASYAFGQSEKHASFLSHATKLTQTSYAVGYQGEPADRFGKYLMTLGQIENVLSTDVFELLNRTSNRAGAIDQYIHDLQALQTEAVSYADMVNREMAMYKTSYDQIVSESNQFEQDFFDATSRYQPQAANDALKKFVDLSQQAVDLKAHNLALAKLASAYSNGLPKLDARIRDIRLNREPLIRGVKVFDVKDSSLNLILPDKNLE